MPGKKEIINLLEEIADMLEFKGENIFKVNAYRSGANALRGLQKDINDLIKNKQLDQVKGIGKSLQSVIYEFNEKGVSSLHEKLKQEIPPGVGELLRIRGLGSKKIYILFNELGISTIGELEYACSENRLALLKGFGLSTQTKILEEIERLKKFNKFVLLSSAQKLSDEIRKKLSLMESVSRCEISGELRRGLEIISSIVFVVLIKSKTSFDIEIDKYFEFDIDGEKYIIHSDYEIPLVVYPVISEKEFCYKLFTTTGSDEFVNKYFMKKNISGCRTEEEVFSKAKITYVIPEMREKEVLEIKNDRLKENSELDIKDFKGILHFHTTYSDGRDTLAEMLTAIKEKGFLYAAVCDHSKSAYYAKGLPEDKILEQKKEVKKLSVSLGIKVLQGIESDILQDGNLDYSNEFLSNLDFVAASVHSRFQMNENEMTARIIKAVENPYTDVLAHPTGRLLLSREPYKVNVHKILDACIANKVAVEINANPRRLDIDWRHVYYGRERGCLFSINTDAHFIEELDLLKYGIVMGRKGGLQPEEVINCFDFHNFKLFLNRKVKRL